MGGRPGASFRQNCSEPLSFTDFLRHFNNCRRISPRQRKAVRLFFSDQAVFKTIDGKSDGRSAGNRIHSVTIADLVRLGHGFNAGVQTHGSEGGNGFIFRTRAFFHFKRAGFYFSIFFARHAATETGSIPGMNFFLNCCRTQLIDIFPIRHLPVFNGNIAGNNAHIQMDGGAG